MSKKRNLFIFSIIVFLVPLVSSSFVANYFIQNESEVAKWGLLEWLIATLLFTFTSAFALTPPTFIALVFGYFMSWSGFPSLSIINIGAITILYFIGNYLSENYFSNWLESSPKSRKIIDSIKKEELKVIFLSKLSPALPFTLTNLVFAHSGAKLTSMIKGGFLGMIPRTLLAIFIGAQAHEIRTILENPNEKLLPKIVLITLFILSTFGLIQIAQKQLSKT